MGITVRISQTGPPRHGEGQAAGRGDKGAVMKAWGAVIAGPFTFSLLTVDLGAAGSGATL